MGEENINALAEKYQELRNIPGKVGGGEYDERVDSPTGEKYAVLRALGDQLGLPGTPAANILATLGKPDELTPSLQQQSATIQTMPGPAIPAGEGASAENNSPAFYFVYNIVPKEDYLYFKIDPVKETVITSDWHRSSE